MPSASSNPSIDAPVILRSPRFSSPWGLLALGLIYVQKPTQSTAFSKKRNIPLGAVTTMTAQNEQLIRVL
jgi:hypothetical protein